MPDTTPAEELRTAAKRLSGAVAVSEMNPWPTMITLRPDVVLAIAAWLEAEADAYEVYESANTDKALAVARAYLGTTQPAPKETTDAR